MPRLRTFTLGVGWFVITSLPTSVFVLAEAENDHRMFLPFIGGGLAVLSLAAYAFARLWPAPSLRLRVLTGTAVLSVGCAMAWGTWQRNAVWRNDLSLMGDVVRKSPGNARGWMNYGVAQLGHGDAPGALASLQRAYALNPTYGTIGLNLGIVHGVLQDSAAAEVWFKRAMQQAPADASAKYFYARWLQGQGRLDESAALLQVALSQNKALLTARHLLMRIYLEQARGPALWALAQDTAALLPQDARVAQMLRLAPHVHDALSAAHALVALDPSADSYLNLSLQEHRAGHYPACIAAAGERPENFSITSHL